MKNMKLKPVWERRLRNRGLWVSVGSLLGLIIMHVTRVPMGQWEIFWTALLSILTFLGLLNDPTTENCGFRDDREHGEA